MRILIAEDENVSCRVLESTLQRWGFEVVVTRNGTEAWSVLQSEDAPPIAILDVVMPGYDGVELCRMARRSAQMEPVYIILLTSHTTKEHIVAGLEAGADDYIGKPFDRDELRARLSVAARVVELQRNLAKRLGELESALAQVKNLQGLLPICSYCKSIRDDQNYWQQVESYICDHTDAQFSHSICPDCYENIVRPELLKLKASKEQI